MIRHALVAAALLCASGASADPAGLWVTPEGKAKVRVSDCGAALCGTIVSLKEPNAKDGKPKTDIHNGDEAKRGRPIVGVSILSGMKKDGDRWQGEIYNPEDGRTYSAYMTEQPGDKLKVQGCALKIICKTQIWTRG